MAKNIHKSITASTLLVRGLDARRFHHLKGLLDRHLAAQHFTIGQLVDMAEASLSDEIDRIAQERPQPQHAGGIALAILRELKKTVGGRALSQPQERLQAYLSEARALESEFRELGDCERSGGLAQVLFILDVFQQLEAVFAIHQITPSPEGA